MFNPRSLFIALLFFPLLFLSCQKDNEDGGGNNPPPSSDLWGSGISISISGRVLDQNGTAVSGAQVRAGSSSTTTDALGVFRLSGVSAFAKLGYVKVEKAGYFPGSRSFVPDSSIEVVEIRLLTKTPAGTVSGITGGTAVAQGISVELVPNSVVKSDNTPHTGNVRVFVANIDPTGPEFTQEMPGNLIAVQNNQAQGLTSFGMVAVELRNYSGQPLKLAQGQTATVKFPIAPGLQATAPATIDLWSFDEQNGFWKHEGQANRIGNKYIAQVSHFSFWNCDVPWNMVLLDGIVRDANNQPVQGATVTITGSNMGSASDITNIQGSFGGYVPANTLLTISVTIGCGGGQSTVYAANIGPLTSNTSLQSISINSQSITTITGTVVDCNNAALPNSYVFANGQVYFAPNGQFSFQACGNNVSITPYGTGPWLEGSAQPITLSGSSVSAGNLQVCSGGGGTGSVTDIDANTYSTVIIGTQEWMAENLKVSKYRNGDPIPTNLDEYDWELTTSGACAFFDYDTVKNTIYGKLYNWYAVVDPRGLCPTGWHVPTDSEWNILVKSLDPQADTSLNSISQSQIAGGLMKATGTLLAGTGLWDAPNVGATNSSGFFGLPGGCRGIFGGFGGIGMKGYWWSSSPSLPWDDAFSRVLSFDDAIVIRTDGSKTPGFSVRCVRD